MMAKPPCIAGLLLVVLIGTGCRQNDRPGGRSGSAATTTEKKTVHTVEPIDEAGLQRLIKQRDGRILFLNVWATWCAPCVEEFPDLVRLSRAYDETQVEVVGISADYPDEIDSKIVPFLDKQNVPFRVYVAKFDRQEDFINAVNRSWSGALPASGVYDPQGNQRFFLIGKGTFEQFKKEIDNLKVTPQHGKRNPG
jgi:thiol-disulfide isomerase/thioredoxin